MKTNYDKAPFPWHGGKGRIADEVWQAFGPLDRYIEPFFGSGAVLLRCPWPAKTEIIADTSPHISNFWRSIQLDPLAVARWADYPSVHHDLRARNLWLANWARENWRRNFDDPNYFDAKAAGWFAWGCSLWIGGGYGEGKSRQRPFVSSKDLRGRGINTLSGEPDVHDRRPSVKAANNAGRGVNHQREELEVDNKIPTVNSVRAKGGAGVSQQRESLEDVHDKRPSVKGPNNAGKGVSQQRVELEVDNQRPHVHHTSAHGLGCSQQRTGLEVTDGIPRVTPMPLDGTRLAPWLLHLCERLRRVVLLRSDWTSAVTDVMTMRAGGGRFRVGIFLDPPYKTEHRSNALYGSDLDGSSDDIAVASYEWAVKKAEERKDIKIVYCCRKGDFPLAAGWTEIVKDFRSVHVEANRAKNKDCIMFSPACSPDQADLFAIA